jgi:hypothetical protein
MSRSAAARDTLPRELYDFVVELAVCAHKRAIYPATHPILHGSVEALHGRLLGLLSSREALSIGVANRELVVDGNSTEEDHPLMRELAGQLHNHQIGVLRFSRGLTRDELEDLLGALAPTIARGTEPLGTLPASALNRWQHIVVHPMAFDRLALLREGEGEAPGTPRAVELWLALARAALVGGWSDDAVHDPRKVAASIDGHQGDAGFDQMIIGCLVQLVDELKATGAVASSGIQRRVSELIGHLSNRGLTRLLGMGTASSRGTAFLANANQTLAAQAVVELVRAASATAATPISNQMLRLLGKMAKDAESDSPRARESDQMLRLTIRKLLDGWTLQNPNPEAYDRVLDSALEPAPRQAIDHRRDTPEPERMIDLALETETLGLGAEAAFDRLVHRDGVAATFDRLRLYRDSAVKEALVDRLLNEAAVREQLAQDRPDLALLQEAVDRMRSRAVEPLLDALERRADSDAIWLTELLARIDWDALEILGHKLPSLSPRVLRYVLTVFGQIDAWPPNVDPLVYARHADPAVRREAVRYLLKVEATRDEAILLALRDRDDRVLNIALTVMGRGCTAEAAELLMRRVDDSALTSELRVRAIRAVGACQTSDVLAWLLAIATTTRWYSSRPRVRKPTAEVVAAVAAIAAHYHETPEGAHVTDLARRHRAAEVRRAAMVRVAEDA